MVTLFNSISEMYILITKPAKRLSIFNFIGCHCQFPSPFIASKMEFFIQGDFLFIQGVSCDVSNYTVKLNLFTFCEVHRYRNGNIKCTTQKL